jgi:hypothetical protein
MSGGSARQTEAMGERKAAFLEAFPKKAGIVTAACSATGISRAQYYSWLQSDKAFAAAIDDINEQLIDYSESQLMSKIQAGNMTAIIFHLKCKGKKRGWVERQEVTGADGVPLHGAASEEEERRLRSMPLDDLKRIRDIYRAGSTAAVVGGGGQDPRGEEPTRVH